MLHRPFCVTFMATIITVHGTFASGPEAGSAWWQTGSAFENQLRELVEGEDGRLDFMPFAWDGLNSETSRRTAGKALALRLDELERKGEPYGLIGHSHGGTVILSALTQTTYRRRPLPGLSRWITVGTPFVAFQRKAFLFSRLGLIGRAAYISLMTYACFFAMAFWLDNANKDSRAGLFVIILIAAVFYVAHLLIGWGTDRRTRLVRRILLPEYRQPVAAAAVWLSRQACLRRASDRYGLRPPRHMGAGR